MAGDRGRELRANAVRIDDAFLLGQRQKGGGGDRLVD